MNNITLTLTTLWLAPSAASFAADLPPLRKEYQERQRRVDQWYAPAR